VVVKVLVEVCVLVSVDVSVIDCVIVEPGCVNVRVAVDVVVPALLCPAK